VPASWSVLPVKLEPNYRLSTATVQAFKADYKHPNSVIAAFLTHMESCREQWATADNSKKKYSPYFAVVQGSMMGKTRLFFQLAHRNVFVFCICLRNVGATGFPHSISNLQKALTSPSCNEGYYAAFLLTALSKLKVFREKNGNCLEWLAQQGEQEWWSDILGSFIST
jgi:hypothetical protein